MRTTIAAFAALVAGAIAQSAVVIAQSLDGSPSNIAAGAVSSKTAFPRPREARRVETAVFAGGCFWCTQFVFSQAQGVIGVECGYCGGTAAKASYDKVHRGASGHAVSIRVTYDPTKISYGQLLDIFFDAHDPTQFNRQGDDVGRQYRSAIFYADAAQKRAAAEKMEQLRQKKTYHKRIVTALEPLKDFYPAEEVHQNFAWKNPFSPYVQDHAIPMTCSVRDKHPELFQPQK
jgi:methionine-S-sulfoxide reductase